MKVVPFPSRPPFETVYEENYSKIYKYVYMLLLNKEEAEDIVSATFLTAFEQYDKYDPSRAGVTTWLARIAHNRAVDRMRSSDYRTKEPLPEEDSRGFEDPELARLTDGTDQMAYRILSRLTQEERDFLNMRFGLELSNAEVSALLDLKENSVSKRYQRLLDKCRKIAEEIGA